MCRKNFDSVLEYVQSNWLYLVKFLLKTVAFMGVVVAVCCINYGFCLYTLDFAANNPSSYEYVSTNFWINSEDPTPSGFFLSSYSHEIRDSGNHLINNISCFFALSIIIGFLSIHRNDAISLFPKRYLIFVYGAILLLLPFVISEVCVIIAAITFCPCLGAKGFSGIVWAFFSVFLYMIYSYIMSLRPCNEKIISIRVVHVLITIFYFVTIIAIPTYFIYQAFLSTDVILYGDIGHLTGFIFGLLVAYSFDKILPKGRMIEDETTENEKERL